MRQSRSVTPTSIAAYAAPALSTLILVAAGFAPRHAVARPRLRADPYGAAVATRG
jgi:hypothetical protein